MPNKLALLIGINKYPYLAEFAQLKGCQNDVFALKAILEQKFEFPPENIHTLLDEQATRSEILDAMKLMVANCGDNDSFVFSFSGHGSRLRARKKNKPSGWYETIMPFDSGRKKYHPQGVNLDITDDEIYEWLMALSEKTPNVVLIFDSCYAGSIIRADVFESGTRGIPSDDTVIREAPVPVFFHANPVTGENVSDEKGPSGWLPLSNKYVLFAACAEHERAHLFKEQNGDKIIEYGALTYFLCQALREARSGDTYRDIWDQVYLNVKNRFVKQSVQLEGHRDRELFGLKEFPPFRFLLVNGQQNNRLTLFGGLLQGVTPNSRWVIYPPGTKYADSDVKILGNIKVISVQTAKAKAVLIEENNTNIIKAGSRAVEISRPRGKSRLNIWVENVPSGFKEQFNQLKQNLCKSPLLKVNTRKELADARIYLLSNFKEQINDPLKLQTGNILEPVWVVYGQDDCLLMSPRTNTEVIVENLEHFCRYRRILELRNPNSDMMGKIDFIILKQNRNLSWSETKPVGLEQKLVIHESDRIALRIVNRFESPVFFSILDLGLSKKISLLYPPPGASVMVGAFGGQSVKLGSQAEGKGIFTIGMNEKERFKLSFPEDFPFIEPFPGNSNVLDEGLEIFKLIVTTRPHDLSFLQQGYMRTKKPSENPVENLIINTLRGDVEFDKEPLFKSENEWLATEKFFFLKRN